MIATGAKPGRVTIMYIPNYAADFDAVFTTDSVIQE